MDSVGNMRRYTILEDPEADVTVQEVLDKIVSEVVSLLGRDLQAMVLVGGYGRGEGGIYQSSVGYQLVNDFEI